LPRLETMTRSGSRRRAGRVGQDHRRSLADLSRLPGQTGRQCPYDVFRVQRRMLLAAELLDRYQATAHWQFLSYFPQRFPTLIVAPGHPRFVHDCDRLTAGGVASGLDASLKLVELLGGKDLAGRAQQATVLSRPAGEQCATTDTRAMPDPTSSCLTDREPDSLARPGARVGREGGGILRDVRVDLVRPPSRRSRSRMTCASRRTSSCRSAPRPCT